MRDCRALVLGCLIAMVGACSSNPPAPVIDRVPASKPSAPAATKPVTPAASSKPAYKPGDWRPTTYTVKKGDTLFGIGLEFGYDYKELAAANNIQPPYNIRVGQVIKLEGIDDKPGEKATDKEGVANSDGVVTYPINGEPTVTAKPATPTKTTSGIVVLNEPKAIREAYSEEALKKVAPIPAKTTEKPVAPTETATATTAKPEAKINLESTDDIDWAWPTRGKVVANFNESSNKGLDISGTTGQSINAAAPGKVIYSGSDLRGYGKLVIIKHNKNYLSVYAHNSLIVVKEGQQVSRGQKIAEMGNTDSDSVKLHFEIRRQGKSIDPSKYLSAN